jgi:hypothetical protein
MMPLGQELIGAFEPAMTEEGHRVCARVIQEGAMERGGDGIKSADCTSLQNR